jgi:hypothetical protein
MAVATSGANQTFYTGLAGDTAVSTNSTVGGVMPFACVMDKLYANTLAVGSSGSDNITVTVVKNGSDTALTCTGNAALTAVSQTSSCSDTSHSVSISAGDVMTIKYFQANLTGVTIRTAVGTSCH